MESTRAQFYNAQPRVHSPPNPELHSTFNIQISCQVFSRFGVMDNQDIVEMNLINTSTMLSVNVDILNFMLIFLGFLSIVSRDPFTYKWSKTSKFS